MYMKHCCIEDTNDIVIKREDLKMWVSKMIHDLRNDYNITSLGGDYYRVVITSRKLSLLERYRIWRVERKGGIT